ncbi:hypothetical protein CTI12_AA479270 [Artemisia annua]|uniref:Uncharacterized protein n=1 Tax=Artemisia annua TaxID=35608 RepID=A0A2U1LJT3_ARTAN|nr:hypothetical protein CTI12_AA479270 [Artemisia annua]
MMVNRKTQSSCIDLSLRSDSLSILINESPTEEFFLERGIRHGDPFSLFFFIVAAERLKAMVSAKVDKWLFKGISVGNDNVMVLHQEYAMIPYSLEIRENIRVAISHGGSSQSSFNDLVDLIMPL